MLEGRSQPATARGVTYPGTLLKAISNAHVRSSVGIHIYASLQGVAEKQDESKRSVEHTTSFSYSESAMPSTEVCRMVFIIRLELVLPSTFYN